MPDDNRALAVAAGVGLLAAGGTIWWLSRPKKAAPRPPTRGVVSAVGLPSLAVVKQEGGMVSEIGLPSLAVLV